MGMTAQQLIEMLEKDGWLITEKKLDASGIEGSYTPDDVVACAKYCWGVPDRLVKYRPELIRQFTGQHIVNMAGAGRSGLAALRAIFKGNAEDLHQLDLSSDQLDTLFNNIRTVPVGITMREECGKTFIKGLMGKINDHEGRKAAFLEEVGVGRPLQKNRDTDFVSRGFFFDSGTYLPASLPHHQASVAREESEKVAAKKTENHYMDFGDDQYGSPVVDRFRPA